MAKHWGTEQREAAAKRARQTRPWRYSTGPRTAEGKRTSSRNAYKHGHYGFETQVLGWYLRLCALRLKQVKARRDMKIFYLYEKYRQKTKTVDDLWREQRNELSSKSGDLPRNRLRFPDHFLKNGGIFHRSDPKKAKIDDQT